MAKLPSQYLLDSMFNFVGGDHQTKYGEPRIPGFSISGLSNVCARQVVLYHKLHGGYPADATFTMESLKRALHEAGEPMVKVLSSEPEAVGRALTQDYGNALHDWVRLRYLGPMGQLYGRWFCAGCGEETEGFMNLECGCGLDWRESMTYREFEVFLDLHGFLVSGHIDGIWVHPETGEMFILELKTVGSSKYEKIRRPFFNHVVQATGYMKARGLKRAIIIYFDRGKQCKWTFRGGHSKAGEVRIKSYTIPFNNDLWDLIDKSVGEYREALDLVSHPDSFKDIEDVPWQQAAQRYEPICDIKSCETAKNCPVSDECFEADDFEACEV